jgi:hypothetical protein
VGEGEEGRVEGRYEEKNGGPSTPLKYDINSVFSSTFGKTSYLWRTDPKKRCFVFSSTLSTDGLGSAFSAN